MLDRENIIDNWYKNGYSKINSTAIDGSFSYKYLHKSLERNLSSKFSQSLNQGIILEIGANNGEHIPFVSPTWNRYTATDIKLPNWEIWDQLYKESLERNPNGNLKFELADAHKLPFKSETFDRVIVTCVLHHLLYPELAMEEIRRCLKPRGIVSFRIPNDLGILYRSARFLTSHRKARKEGLDRELELIHALEHRNHYLSIRALIYEVFKNDLRFEFRKPFGISSYNLNLITIMHIIKTI